MSEPRTRPRQDRSEATLAKLRAAAQEILVEVGRDELTTQLIADRAGVSIGTLYRYYTSRIAVLADIQPVAVHGVDAVLALHRKVTHYTPLGLEEVSFTDPREAADAAWYNGDHETDPNDDELEAEIAKLLTFEVCAECGGLEATGVEEGTYEYAIWPCRTIIALTGERP